MFHERQGLVFFSLFNLAWVEYLNWLPGVMTRWFPSSFVSGSTHSLLGSSDVFSFCCNE